MNKYIITLASTAILSASTAFAAEPVSYESKVSIQKGKDGDFVKDVKEVTKDTLGTKVEVDEKSKVDVDSEGNETSTYETKSVKDPKGLLNKTTVETKDVAKVKNGKTEKTYVRTVNGKKVQTITTKE